MNRSGVPEPNIAYNPKHYVCRRADGPLELDGHLDKPFWEAAPWTDDFVDIEGALRPLPAKRTRAKMLWDDDYFYFGAELEEDEIWATLTERDSVIFYDNDFEIFIDRANRKWSVEIAMPWDSLRECAPGGRRPAEGDCWRVNFSRVEWHVDVRDGAYEKRKDPSTGRPWPEENWVWSPMGNNENVDDSRTVLHDRLYDRVKGVSDVERTGKQRD